jgi:putative acetyltransferase
MNVTLRSYVTSDEDAAITLWHRTWQVTYPDIDFAARVEWWRDRWRTELVPKTKIVVAESDGKIVGFVTINQRNGYLDQIVVALEALGTSTGALLLDEAKRLSPKGVTLKVNSDNARAIAFYRKHGFVRTGGEINPVSGRPIDCLEWRP